MSREFDNTNRGALFKNKNRTDKQPNYRGSLNVAGTDYWLSAWINKSKAGDAYMSLSIQPKDAQNAGRDPEPAKASQDFNDDLPFAWAAIAPLGMLLAGWLV